VWRKEGLGGWDEEGGVGVTEGAGIVGLILDG